MKDKPIVIIITLLGGAVSSICCILKGTGLLWTLLITFITLVAFLIIGLIVNKFFAGIKADLYAQKRAQEKLEEEKRIAEQALKAEREEWMRFHPNELFPGDLEQENAKSEADAAGQEGV